ncbi:MAG: sugar ABC transporter substrate-binding protein [Lachnospiraceae bacterium]|nr:sugar ABC transporter substrate-binding protein [Lachnospiraceae bacterium]
MRVKALKKYAMLLTAAGLFGIVLFFYVKAFLIYKEDYGKHRYIVGATYMTMNNQFYTVINNELKSVIESKGDKLITLDPALDQKKQNEQIRYLIQEGADVIVLNPVDWKKVKSGLKAAKKAGVPVVVVDTEVYDEEYVTTTILSDNYQAGRLCAEDMMKKKKKANILLLTHAEAKSGVDRIQGFLDRIEGNPQYAVLDSIDTQGQTERTLPKVESALKSNPDIDVIMALNDPTALGALAAIESQNYRRPVLVYSVDGSPDGKKLISEGLLTGTAVQSPKMMGKTTVDTIYKLFDQKYVRKEIELPVELINNKNIHDYDISRWE